MQRPELDAISLLAWPGTRTGSVEHSFLFRFFSEERIPCLATWLLPVCY